MPPTKIKKELVRTIHEFRASPLPFIEKMWGLKPQPLKPEYQRLATIANASEFDPSCFEPFVPGKHITWQQWLICRAVEQGINGQAPRWITVRSGHGTGKSSIMAMLILWFLFCWRDAQVPCTAPTSEQMHDILWKELSKWLNLMPDAVKHLYVWQENYIRMAESPDTWFARAKTARKENTEALAGVHGSHVALCVDEASGVPEQIFSTALGAFTGGNILFFMISNGTRRTGFFFDSHNKDKSSWQTLHLNGEESPIVERAFVDMIVKKYGKDSDEYEVRVRGNFPREGIVDDGGYAQLIKEADVNQIEPQKFIGRVKLGVDPAGAGKNKTRWVGRDKYIAVVLAEEAISTGKGIAQKTLTLMSEFGVKPHDVYVDDFGEGSKTVQELALAGKAVRGVNTGSTDVVDKRFLNRRAEIAWRCKDWLRQGGQLVRHLTWIQLLYYRYRPTLQGKIQLMPKEEMKKKFGIESPDTGDAAFLTFWDADEPEEMEEMKAPTIEYDRFGRPKIS